MGSLSGLFFCYTDGRPFKAKRLFCAIVGQGLGWVVSFFSHKKKAFKGLQTAISIWLAISVFNLPTVSSAIAQPVLSDPNASRATSQLYAGLFRAMQKGTMFGHQDDLAYGVHWKYEDGKSDIKLVTGEYPAVYGWELGNLELGSDCNLDSVPFDKMKKYICEVHARGGVNTISWHTNNPQTGGSAWDCMPATVASILPGGSKHALYLEWLDKLAAFFLDLRSSEGELIPVLFRPFHELNGNWFWWGSRYCTPDEYKRLWQFTIGYLRHTKGLHHLIYTFNTDKFSNREEYLERYPGNSWVDVIGFDIYQREMAKEEYTKAMHSMLANLTAIASDSKKLPALTEFGGNNATDAKWWTGTFLPILKKYRLSYVLAWRNAGKKADGSLEYYVPFPGEASEKDFKKLFSNKGFLFQKRASKLNLYE